MLAEWAPGVAAQLGCTQALDRPPIKERRAALWCGGGDRGPHLVLGAQCGSVCAEADTPAAAAGLPSRLLKGAAAASPPVPLMPEAGAGAPKALAAVGRVKSAQRSSSCDQLLYLQRRKAQVPGPGAVPKRRLRAAL